MVWFDSEFWMNVALSLGRVPVVLQARVWFRHGLLSIFVVHLRHIEVCPLDLGPVHTPKHSQESTLVTVSFEKESYLVVLVNRSSLSPVSGLYLVKHLLLMFVTEAPTSFSDVFPGTYP